MKRKEIKKERNAFIEVFNGIPQFKTPTNNGIDNEIIIEVQGKVTFFITKLIFGNLIDVCAFTTNFFVTVLSLSWKKKVKLTKAIKSHSLSY